MEIKDYINYILEADEADKYTHVGAGTYVKKGDTDKDGKPKEGVQKFTKDDAGKFKPVKSGESEKPTDGQPKPEKKPEPKKEVKPAKAAPAKKPDFFADDFKPPFAEEAAAAAFEAGRTAVTRKLGDKIAKRFAGDVDVNNKRINVNVTDMDGKELTQLVRGEGKWKTVDQKFRDEAFDTAAKFVRAKAEVEAILDYMDSDDFAKLEVENEDAARGIRLYMDELNKHYLGAFNSSSLLAHDIKVWSKLEDDGTFKWKGPGSVQHEVKQSKKELAQIKRQQAYEKLSDEDKLLRSKNIFNSYPGEKVYATDSGFAYIVYSSTGEVKKFYAWDDSEQLDISPEETKAVLDKLRDGSGNPQFDSAAEAHQSKGKGGVPTGRISYDKEKLSEMLGELAKGQEVDGVPAKDFDLCTVQVKGSNLFCGDIPKTDEHPDGIPRATMPQLKTEYLETGPDGKPTKAAQLIRAGKLETKDGEVNAQPYFEKFLEERGFKKEPLEVDPEELKSTQAELSGGKVSGMMSRLEKEKPGDKGYDAITAPIFVSEDGYILDGHHRWAAVQAYNVRHPDKPLKMQVEVIKAKDGSKFGAEEMVELANEFQDDFGLKRKVAGETTGTR